MQHTIINYFDLMFNLKSVRKHESLAQMWKITSSQVNKLIDWLIFLYHQSLQWTKTKPSSETQGQFVGARESRNGQKKIWRLCWILTSYNFPSPPQTASGSLRMKLNKISTVILQPSNQKHLITRYRQTAVMGMSCTQRPLLSEQSAAAVHSH